MQKYKDFSPTSFDHHINFDDEREDWFVLGVSQNRDSEPLTRANFQSALEILGGESETVEVHRFGHWGPGWFELILLAPERVADGEEIENRLEDYPVLDDCLFSEMENEESLENWTLWGAREYLDKLASVFSLEERTKDFLDDFRDELYQFHQEYSGSNELDFEYLEIAEQPSRNDLATFIRELRKTKE